MDITLSMILNLSMSENHLEDVFKMQITRLHLQRF